MCEWVGLLEDQDPPVVLDEGEVWHSCVYVEPVMSWKVCVNNSYCRALYILYCCYWQTIAFICIVIAMLSEPISRLVDFIFDRYLSLLCDTLFNFSHIMLLVSYLLLWHLKKTTKL